MEGRGFRDHYAAYQKRGIEILGVSNDSVSKQASFAQKEGFPFLLLSDEDGKIGVAYHAMDDPDGSSEKRITYVIGGDGIIIEAYPKVATATHAEEILTKVAAK